MLYKPILHTVTAINIDDFHSLICFSLSSNSVFFAQLSCTPLNNWWSITDSGLLLYNNWIYVLDLYNLYLKILYWKHDYSLLGHFGYNKTLELMWQDYVWPGMQVYILEYCKFCTVCKQCKAPHHCPYRTLQQLPILEKL